MRHDQHTTTAELEVVGPAFAAMANPMVYRVLAAVDLGRGSRTRCGNGTDPVARLVGSPVTPLKQVHLARNPHVSCGFWEGPGSYDTCTAECRAELLPDETRRHEGCERFTSTPPPLGARCARRVRAQS